MRDTDGRSYFRTTAAHNTLFADEEEQRGGAALTWQADAQPPRARGTIAGKGVTYTRTVIVDDPYVVLLDEYQAEEAHRFGWIFHAYGPVQVTPALAKGETPSLGMPPLPGHIGFRSFTDRQTGVADGVVQATWQVTPQLRLGLLAATDGPLEVTAATAPGQPYPDTQGTLLLRAPGIHRRIATVLEPTKGAATLAALDLAGDEVVLTLTDGTTRRYGW